MILLATELGSGHGHLVPLRAAARHLLSRGLRCSFAVHQPAAAEALRLHELGPVLSAPRDSAGVEAVPLQASYASLLHDCGFHEARGLAGRLRIWRQLMQLTGARAVLIDHAPTALLAAHSLGLPVAAIGTGFTLPPVQTPFPAYPGIEADPAVLRANEQKVLAVIQAALAAIGAPPLNDLQALFEGVPAGLLSYVELDHYAVERPQAPIGWPDFSEGSRVDWIDAPPQPRLLAYLRPSVQLEDLLKALAESPAQVLVRVMDTPVERLAPFQRPGMVITHRNIDLRQALESCDAFICSGSHGVVAEALLAGKPCLVQEVQWEQRLLAKQLSRLGAALVLSPSTAPERLRALLQQLLDDRRLHAAAQDFARRYAGRDRKRILPDWLDAWLAQRALSA